MLFCIANALNQEACTSASVHGVTLHLLLTVQVCLMALYKNSVEFELLATCVAPVANTNAARQMGKQLCADRYVTRSSRQ